MADVMLRDVRAVFKEDSDPAAVIFGQTPGDSRFDHA